jgi:tripartite-type tricarboxylate transporter receptor subunit TctC
MRKICTKALLVAGCVLAGAGSAMAQGYPNRPVTIVVGFAPGGLTDSVTRALANDLSTTLKQPFVVENRSGAAGQIATEYVARRPNDGYTLLVAGTSYVISPAVQKKLNYDPVKDFDPLAILVRSPNVLLMNVDTPVQSLQDFLQWGAKQTNIPFATAGDSSRVTGEMLRKATGFPLTAISYRGAPDVINATIAGQTPLAIQDMSSVATFVSAGKMKPIAITGAERSSLMPQVPTMAELGYKAFDTHTLLALFMPAGAPPETVTTLNNAIRQSMASPKMQAFLKDRFVDPTPPMDVPQLRTFVNAEIGKWRELVRTTGVVLTQ